MYFLSFSAAAGNARATRGGISADEIALRRFLNATVTPPNSRGGGQRPLEYPRRATRGGIVAVATGASGGCLMQFCVSPIPAAAGAILVFSD